MNRYLVVTASCLAAGLGVALFSLNVAPTLGAATAHFLIIDAKGLATFAAFCAFVSFAPGDYLRRPWLLLALAEASLFQTELVDLVIGSSLDPDVRAVLRGTLLTCANVASPVALWMFSRALNAAGLALLGSRAARWSFIAVFVAVALALIGPTLLINGRAVLGGQLSYLPRLVSDLGDVAALVFTAPLLYTVYTLWGGRLSWPYVLLAAGNVCWLLFDAVGTYEDATGARFGSGISDGIRLSALLFNSASALAQIWVLRAMRSREAPIS